MLCGACIIFLSSNELVAFVITLLVATIVAVLITVFIIAVFILFRNLVQIRELRELLNNSIAITAVTVVPICVRRTLIISSLRDIMIRRSISGCRFLFGADRWSRGGDGISRWRNHYKCPGSKFFRTFVRPLNLPFISVNRFQNYPVFTCLFVEFAFGTNNPILLYFCHALTAS